MADEGDKKLGFSKKEWADIRKEVTLTSEAQNKLNNTAKEYYEIAVKISAKQEQLRKLQDALTKATILQKEAKEALIGKSGDALEIAKETLEKASIAQIQAERRIELAEKELEILEDQRKSVNKLIVGLKAVAGTYALITGGINKMWGALKGSGVFEMDKEIRNAARSMNIGNKGFQKFADHMGNAAERTTMWGVGVKDLAIMQKQYSEEIGRSVRLTEEGHASMALLAEGTGLGNDFAVSMAASMDEFGMSVNATKNLVQETTDIAGKMGVNSAAAVKTLQQNLKLAQRFSFKNGVKGLTTMANKAAALKLDMDGIAGLAEKVFRPEGAVEMAAQLATMGGNFAALGDPFQLMFKARNDLEGFALDIGKATSEFVSFNKETGGFDIQGGLAADRMREISNMTGIAVEELTKMATQQKKIEQFGKMTPFSMNDEDSAMIARLAEFNTDNKQFEISVGKDVKELRNLSAQDLKNIKAEQKTLKERAEQARTFQENIQDLTLQLQQLLLPVAQMLKDEVGDKLKALNDQWVKEDFYKSLKDFVRTGIGLAKAMGQIVEWGGKFITNTVNLLGPGGTLAAVLAGWGALKVAQWFINGVALGRGFLATTRTGGTGSGGLSTLTRAGKSGKVGLGNIGKATKIASKSKALKGGGLLTGLLAGGSEIVESRKEGKGWGKSLLKGGIRGGLAGGGAWGGASAGAAIGALAVPLAPVTVPLGALLGGIAGGLGGNWLGEKGSNMINDGIIQFNPKDKFLQFDDAMIAGTHEGGNKELAKTLQKDKETTTGGGIIKHVFDNLNINIKIYI